MYFKNFAFFNKPQDSIHSACVISRLNLKNFVFYVSVLRVFRGLSLFLMAKVL